MADINFTYDTSGIDAVKDTIKDKITIDTYEIEVPEKLYETWAALIDALDKNITTNINNLIDSMKKYWDQQAEELKIDIENSLALDPNKTYNIHVKTADKALDSDKLSGKTYNDIITDISANYIATATVTNSLKFNGYDFDSFKKYIQHNIIIDNAVNSNKLNNLTYEEIKSDIISQIQNNNIDYDAIQNKVENEWKASSAKIADAFGDINWDANYWKQNIIPSIKINNAIEADYLVGDSGNKYNFSDIQNIISTKVSDYVNSKVSSDNTDFVNLVKSIKVSNADNADNAITATKLGNYTASGLIDHIKNSVTVNKALKANYILDGNDTKSYQDIVSYVSNQVLNLKNDLVNGNVIPAKAITVDQLDGKTVSQFKQEIIDQAQQAAANNTDAKSINGYDFDNLMKYIKNNVKVNEALNADKFNNFSYNDMYDDLKGKFTWDLVPDKANSLTYNGLYDTEFFSILSDDVYQNLIYDPTKFSTDPNLNLFYFKTNEIYAVPATKTEFNYDDNGNIISVIYYFNYDSNASEQKPFVNYFREDTFEYDDNNNVTLEKNIFYLRFQDDGDTEAKNYKLTVSKTYNYDSSKVKSIDYSFSQEEYTEQS